jgi:hypothetical protein
LPRFEDITSFSTGANGLKSDTIDGAKEKPGNEPPAFVVALVTRSSFFGIIGTQH